jgi:PTH2 family peptidyl-tRNA hydrolase
MSEVKQVIVVRKDLNMRKGKLAAQVAHAAIKVILDNMSTSTAKDHEFSIKTKKISYNSGSALDVWLDGSFTKVVVSVNSEDEIFDLGKKAKEKNIPYAIIIDNGFTEFNGKATVTCIAIGPHWSESIDELTKDLPLI